MQAGAICIAENIWANTVFFGPKNRQKPVQWEGKKRHKEYTKMSRPASLASPVANPRGHGDLWQKLGISNLYSDLEWRLSII